MGMQYSEKDLSSFTTFGNDVIQFQLEVMKYVASIVSSVPWFWGLEVSKHLQEISSVMQAYSREENLTLPSFHHIESLFHIAKGWMNMVNPYHSFLESQKTREMFFKVALQQIQICKQYNFNPLLIHSLQRMENFCRANLAFTFTFNRPEWNLDFAQEEVANLDFCKVMKFSPEKENKNGRNILLTAPMSGHFATLLRKTIDALCKQGYTVFITDWKSPFDVSQNRWDFTVDRYSQEVQNTFQEVQNHIRNESFDVMAVCQPSPETLTAVAHAEKHGLAKPRSIALMAWPIDISQNPTKVNEAGAKLTPEILERLKLKIPNGYIGEEREVYPAAIQIMGFIMTKPEEHMNKFMQLAFKSTPFTQEEEKMLAFYTEYFAVMDLPYEFYKQTVQRIFQNNEWATWKVSYYWEQIDFSHMKTPLITFEAFNDDITWIGQTKWANIICPNAEFNEYILVKADNDNNLSWENPQDLNERKEKKVGHYGIFAGKYFREVVILKLDSFYKKIEEKIKKAA